MELTGNLHFEAFMIFFTLVALYFLCQKRSPFSAVCLGLAVCSKLLPLIILPLLFKRLGFRNWLSYCLIVGSISLVLFFFSSRRRHTRFDCDWSSDVCSSDLGALDHDSPAKVHGERSSSVPCGSNFPLVHEVLEFFCESTRP